MRRETSTYLNAVRFLAALVVFLGHVAGKRFTGGFLWPLSDFMDVAVIIFFVLSGYVIAYVTDSREQTLRLYAVNRIARVLSVTIPALILTYLLDTAGRHIHPDYYSAAWGFSNDHVWLQYLAALTFTNQLWWNDINVGSMLPYWSLGFEVWYYAIFAAFWFSRGPTRYILTPALCLIAGPRILALFPIWIGGFALYHMSRTRLMTPGWGLLLFGATISVPLLMLAQTIHSGPHMGNSLIVRYAVALVFALNIIAVQSAGGYFSGLLKSLEKPINWFAGMTFSLYLYHLPVAQFLTTTISWPPQALATRVTIIAGTFGIVILLALLTEHRKNIWRRLIARLFDKLQAGDSALRPLSPS